MKLLARPPFLHTVQRCGLAKVCVPQLCIRLAANEITILASGLELRMRGSESNLKWGHGITFKSKQQSGFHRPEVPERPRSYGPCGEIGKELEDPMHVISLLKRSRPKRASVHFT